MKFCNGFGLAAINHYGTSFSRRGALLAVLTGGRQNSRCRLRIARVPKIERLTTSAAVEPVCDSGGNERVRQSRVNNHGEEEAGGLFFNGSLGSFSTEA